MEKSLRFMEIEVAPIRMRWKHKDESVADDYPKDIIFYYVIRSYEENCIPLRTYPEVVLVQAGLSRLWTSNTTKLVVRFKGKGSSLIFPFFFMCVFHSSKYFLSFRVTID